MRERKTEAKNCLHCGRNFQARIDTDRIAVYCSRKCYYLTKPTHGFSQEKHPLYKAWSSMRDRCLCKTNANYKHYGGRGIIICEAWLKSFDNFLIDMADTWQPGLSLNRKDNNGPYSKDNCIWSSDLEQNNNKRNTIIVNTPRGKMPLADACRVYDVSYSVAVHRHNRGWPDCYLFI